MHEFYTKLPMEGDVPWARMLLDWDSNLSLPEITDLLLDPDDYDTEEFLMSDDGKIIRLAMLRDALALMRYPSKVLH